MMGYPVGVFNALSTLPIVNSRHIIQPHAMTPLIRTLSTWARCISGRMLVSYEKKD